MAGYHYKLQIVPNGYIATAGEEDDFWVSEQPDIEMLDNYRRLLPEENHWGETEEFRSKDNYSVLYIWWEDERVWSIQFEYAPLFDRSDDLLNSILFLCNKYGYRLYSEGTGSVVSPSKEALWKDFKKGHPYAIYERKGLSEFR